MSLLPPSSAEPVNEAAESKENDKMRVLLADDHESVLREIRNLLPVDFEVVGIAHNGAQMLAAAHELQPDVIVTDIEMPKMSGIEAGREVLKTRPDLPIVLLTMHDDQQLLNLALQAGFRGYVLKISAGEDLLTAIAEVMKGHVFVSPSLSCSPARP